MPKSGCAERLFLSYRVPPHALSVIVMAARDEALILIFVSGASPGSGSRVAISARHLRGCRVLACCTDLHPITGTKINVHVISVRARPRLSHWPVCTRGDENNVHVTSVLVLACCTGLCALTGTKCARHLRACPSLLHWPVSTHRDNICTSPPCLSSPVALVCILSQGQV